VKKNIPYLTIILAILFCIAYILYAVYTNTSLKILNYEEILFLPTILGVFGFFFCKYTKNPKLLKTLNLSLIGLNIVAFYIMLEIID
jgi:hypothetical protein